jgi:hypothetical protein
MSVGLPRTIEVACDKRSHFERDRNLTRYDDRWLGRSICVVDTTGAGG